MKKIKLMFLVLLFLLFFVTPTFAQQSLNVQSAPAMIDSSMPAIIPPDYFPKTTLPFGQNHTYTVNLRGNGQATVMLKTVFSNPDEASLSAVKLTFPTEPQNLNIYQAYRDPQCISYEPMPYMSKPLMIKPIPGIVESNSYPPPDTIVSEDVYRQPVQKCIQYQMPDYLYGWGNTTYHKARYSLNGSEMTVELPKQIKPNGGGSLVLTYTLPGITSKDLWGAYDFSFDSVKVQTSIQNIQVGITVDPDYYLKDALGAINYQTRDASIMSAPSMMALEGAKGISSPQFDQFYSQIGQGTIVKSANNLQPNESFSVKGTYADKKAKLYGREIGIGIIVVLIVLILAFGSLFLAFKKIFGKKENPPDKPKSARTVSYLAVVGTSFGSSLLMLLYSAGIYIAGQFFTQMYPYYLANSFSMLIFIFLTVISLCIYSFLLFTPGVVIGIKRGIWAGVITLIMTILWLVVYGIILFFIIFIFFQNPMNHSYPIQVMPMGAAESGVYRSSGVIGK